MNATEHLIDKSILFQGMTWCHQPMLPEPMLTQVYVSILDHNELVKVAIQPFLVFEVQIANIVTTFT